MLVFLNTRYYFLIASFELQLLVHEWFSMNSQGVFHRIIVRSVNELQCAFHLSTKEEKNMQPLLCVALNSSVVWSAIAVTVECVLFQIVFL
jgi:hypothetical protein